MMARALLAFLALPGLIVFAIPVLIGLLTRQEQPFAWPALLLLVPGMALLLSCVREFFVRGKGTLAPWDPPRHLVASGLYRLSRNPMYLANGLILFGWAIGFRSRLLLAYAVIVVVAFHIRVVRVEERTLARTHRDQWTRYAARVPRWIFRSRRAVVGAWLLLLALVPLAGLVYEAYADGTASLEFTPPGTLVDIGGRRLHLLCIGDGEPTVIFEGSGWGSAVSSAPAREHIASRTTVCSYDRAGIGWSDPAEGPVSIGDQARDLGVLQDRAGLRGPSVLVASSIGGLTAELFARQFPERVAGLVFLDAASSLTLSMLRREPVSRWLEPAACTSGVLSYFGVIRLLDPLRLRQDRTEGARRTAALAYNSRRWMQFCAVARGLPETVRELEEAPPLHADLPLVVLSASSAEEMAPPALRGLIDVDHLQEINRASHEALAKQSSKGRWQVVPDSTHLIASSQPEAVADAVFALLDVVRGQ
jgi:protein-S-isoprenylcysteine O-methyltransferase Ste14/pimeloyl-ACP methyl ester carboxylesterase